MLVWHTTVQSMKLHLKLKSRTVKAEKRSDDVGQGSSSVVHPSRGGWQKKVS